MYRKNRGKERKRIFEEVKERIRKLVRTSFANPPSGPCLIFHLLLTLSSRKICIFQKKFMHNVCPRSLDPFYVVSTSKKCDKISLTYCI